MGTVLKTASMKSVEYLNSLFVERYGDREEFVPPTTQADVSAAIQVLLNTDGIMPATAEQKATILALAEESGQTIAPNATVAGANRQIRNMRKTLSRRTYVNG